MESPFLSQPQASNLSKLPHNKRMQTDQQTASRFADPSACEALCIKLTLAMGRDSVTSVPAYPR